MADPLARLTAEVADLRRRLQALETAPRAALSSIESGGLIIGDAGELDIGTGGALTIGAGGSLDVPNEDGTGSVLNVDAGELHFPIGIGIWTQVGGVISYFEVSDGGPMTFLPVMTTYISLGSNTVDGEFDFTVTGSGSWDINLTARAIGGVHDGTQDPGPGSDGTTGLTFASFEITGNTLRSGPWTIPDTLWDPNGHPGGTVAEIVMYSQRISGTGDCFVRPTKPLMSI